MSTKRVALALSVSSLLSLLVGLLSNLAATYLAPGFADQPWLIYGALAITFAASLVVSLLLLRHTPNSQPDPIPTETQPGAIPNHPVPLSTPSPSLVTSISSIPGKSYRELFGRDQVIGDVTAALRDPLGKWLIALDGMGGIGKTALAREIAERAIAERLFDVAVWEQAPKDPPAGVGRGKGIGALTYESVLDSIARHLGAPDVPKLKKPEKEVRIRTLLQAQRVLVILDNLETAKQPQNEIAAQLRPLLNPSKAVLTSRQRFDGDVFAVHVSGLDESDALRLIRQEANEKHIQRVTTASSGELGQIVQATGGSPLALKLVVGQLDRLPLETVLKQLSEVRLPADPSNEGEYVRFYKGIFLPSWRLLSANSQDLLIAMAHFAPALGGTLEAIAATSGQTGDSLARSIDELWRLSFLEVEGVSGLNNIRYFLHALTHHFVLSDIVHVSD